MKGRNTNFRKAKEQRVSRQIKALFQNKDWVLPFQEFPQQRLILPVYDIPQLTLVTVLVSYLYNGNPSTWKCDLHIDTGLWGPFTNMD